MQDPLARRLARAGNRVLSLDLLGHGDSDRPHGPWPYSISNFADQAVALLDHLDVERAVLGGTSLGANVSLEAAARHPDRVRAMVLEMPVLDGGQPAALAIFTPMILGLRYGAPAVRPLARVAGWLPRGAGAHAGHVGNLADTLLDWVSQDPEHAANLIAGLSYGRTAPPREERRGIETPALVIAHTLDPLHALGDSVGAVQDLPNARLVRAKSFLEMRFAPGRLSDEVASFLDECWAESPAARRSPRRARDASA
jgi:pimeloyl-ACP methyl ester carboxylesterase